MATRWVRGPSMPRSLTTTMSKTPAEIVDILHSITNVRLNNDKVEVQFRMVSVQGWLGAEQLLLLIEAALKGELETPSSTK